MIEGKRASTVNPEFDWPGFSVTELIKELIGARSTLYSITCSEEVSVAPPPDYFPTVTMIEGEW